MIYWWSWSSRGGAWTATRDDTAFASRCCARSLGGFDWCRSVDNGSHRCGCFRHGDHGWCRSFNDHFWWRNIDNRCLDRFSNRFLGRRFFRGSFLRGSFCTVYIRIVSGFFRWRFFRGGFFRWLFFFRLNVAF